MTFATKARPLTGYELACYREDGVVLLRQALEPNWLAMIETGIEEARVDSSLLGKFMSRKVAGYQMDIFLWKRIAVLRDLIFYGPFAHWAQQAMGSNEVRFFYDQMFVKEPGADAPTPWHQDLSFWPIRGEQVCSFWVPSDPVSRENSGLLYVRGSHRWPQRFKAVSPDYLATLIDHEMDDIPDINAEPDKYELIDWDMEPGDVLLFHPLTLHGSYGNQTRTRRRRALALRFTGDDAVWAPSKTRMPVHFHHDSMAGGPLRGAAFPRLLPFADPAEYRASLTREAPQIGGLISGAIDNFVATLRMRMDDFDAERLKQTWSR